VPDKPEPKKPDVAPVQSKHRKSNPWLETAATPLKRQAVRERRRTERLKGNKVPPQELTFLADELERIQREMNPLLTKRDVIIDKLLPHWGHTGVEEIESTLGRTLLSSSFQLCLDQDTLKNALSESQWQRVTRRVIEAQRLLADAKTDPKLRAAIKKALRVKKMMVSVVSPSSRRPKSGEPGPDEES
jgi:hypothetical protein